jgi:hypothetical protein
VKVIQLADEITADDWPVAGHLLELVAVWMIAQHLVKAQ